MKRPVVVRPRRESPIFVCRKCLKRSDQCAKIRDRLKRELAGLGSESRKPPRLVATDCFKICPKGAVVLASGASLADNAYVLVADKDDTAAAVGLLR